MSASINKRNKLHVHLFIVGVIVVLLILLISSLQAKSNNVPPGVIESANKREGCVKSLERSCFQRTTPAGSVMLDNKEGARIYYLCMVNSNYNADYYEIETEWCSDFDTNSVEVVQYCMEGKTKNQFISEFFGQCRKKPLGNAGDSCSSELDCHVEYFCHQRTGLCDDPDKYPDGISEYFTVSPCTSDKDCLIGQSCDVQGFCKWKYCKSDSDCTERGLTNYYCNVDRGQCTQNTTS